METVTTNGAGGMSLSDLMTLVVYVCAAVALLVGLGSVFAGLRRAAATARAQELEAEVFARSLAREASAAAPPRVGAMPVYAPPSTGAPGSVAAPPDSANPVAPADPGNAAASDATSPPNPGGLAEATIERLKQAHLIDYVEGPVRAKNPAIVGQVVMMRNRQRVAILESPMRQNDPDLEILMRQFDGIVIPGPGKDPLFARRFEYYISDQISM